MRFSFIKTLAVVACLSPMSAYAAPEHYTFDANHTNIDWRANHFGFSNPSGKFAKSSGTLVLDEKAPEKSVVDITIDTTSLVTGIEKFDEHLKSPDFLDAKKFPTAHFKSRSVVLTGKDTADVTGDLTLHGITKSVVLKTKLNKIGENSMSHKHVAGFSATTTLNRSDFGIKTGIPAVSDAIILTLEVEAIKDEAAKTN